MGQIFASSLIISMIAFNSTCAQDTVRVDLQSTNELLQYSTENQIELFRYVDSTFMYAVDIPEWLDLQDFGTPTMFGGSLPFIDGVENTIVIHGFDKTMFESWDHFIVTFLTGNKPGEPTLFSPEHIWYGKSTHQKECTFGIRQRIFTFYHNKIFHHDFVLVETPTAFLWIQFGSTPSTYDVNVERFNEFLETFTILK